MKRAEHQLTLPGVEEMKQQDEKAWTELMGFPLSESALKMDVGTGLTPEEKQALWPSEERIDIIGSNGATGEHYEATSKAKVCTLDQFTKKVNEGFRRGMSKAIKKGIGAGSGG